MVWNIMKPRLFIGSSKESLSISYATQQNLCADAEITVWTQGVFQPSKTNLESLLKHLSSCDFGIFIFSPDDILFIREEINQAVRDNVIFELGLFVGHIGKDRCFVLIPDNSEELRIPTDLIGVTPVEYETGRTDDNMQAATGPACHSIRQIIKRLGSRSIDADSANVEPRPPELTKQDKIIEDKINTPQKSSDSSEADDEFNWIFPYLDKKYCEAIKLLEEKISKTTDESNLSYYESMVASAKYLSNPKIGEKSYKAVIAKYPKSYQPYIRFSYDLMGFNLHPDGLAILDSGLSKVINKIPLINAKAKCLQEMGRKDDAGNLLREAITQFKDNPDVYINLANYYIDSEKYEEARLCLEEGLSKIVNNKPLLSKYAGLLYKHFGKKLALIPYNNLIELEPDNPTYLTLRANIYLELDLNDLAMSGYTCANEIAENKQSWIIANIGNLRRNRGFYREAIENLQIALKLSPEYQYAHERLASSIKSRDEELETLSKIIKEAKEQLLSSKFKSDI